MHVLLIEDDTLLGDGVQAGLQAHGFSVAWVTRAADADAGLDSTAFDLVVLDLGLPDQDGLSLLARWRRLGRDEPVLVLTARDGVEHRVTGLNAGADDYLVKPFDLDELVARLHVLLRRSAGRADPVIEYGGLRFEPAAAQSPPGGKVRNQAKLHITPITKELSQYYSTHANAKGFVSPSLSR